MYIDEKWLPVVGFGRFYEVSNYGRVRRVMLPRGTRKLRMLKGTEAKSGHRVVTLFRGKEPEGKKLYVHQVVTRAFLGPCPTGKEVNHKSGNPGDNQLSNLEYVTHTENILHSYRVLQRGVGSQRSQSKLCEDDVLSICKLFASGMAKKAIARKFGVQPYTIRAILAGRAWRHVPRVLS